MESHNKADQVLNFEAFKNDCIFLLQQRVEEDKEAKEAQIQAQLEAEIQARREYNVMPYYLQQQQQQLQN